MTSTLTAPERTGRSAQSASAVAGAAETTSIIGSPTPILGTILPAGDEACEYEYSYDDLFSERLRAAGKPVTHLQTPLPERYVKMAPAELDARIAAARETLGERLMILGHHYQRDEIIKFADVRGDSYKLSQLAAERKEAE